MKVSKILALLVVLSPWCSMAAEVLPATSEDVAAFDREIGESNGQNNDGSFNHDGKSLVAKESRKAREEVAERSRDEADNHNNNGQHGDGEHENRDHQDRDGEHNNTDRGDANQRDNSVDRGDVKSPGGHNNQSGNSGQN